MHLSRILAIGICLLTMSWAPVASSICRGLIINPFTDVSWRCLFPITIGSHKVSSSHLPDTPNPKKTYCVCKHHPFPKIGFALGYWEPMALVDVTRTPYCFVNLNGLHIHHEQKALGAVETQSPDQNGSFYYVHVYHFPVLQMVSSWLLGGSCQSRGQFEMVYASELDPTWRDENLAKIVFPETATFLNPLVALGSQASCLGDSLLANSGLPHDFPWWCAGSQGFMYPLTGKVVEHVSSIQAGVLMAERILFKLHRLGRIQDTNCNQLCGEHTDLFMAKSRYRYQMVYPRTSTCRPFGRTTQAWIKPMDLLKGDDMSFLIWRKKNCCHD